MLNFYVNPELTSIDGYKTAFYYDQKKKDKLKKGEYLGGGQFGRVNALIDIPNQVVKIIQADKAPLKDIIEEAKIGTLRYRTINKTHYVAVSRINKKIKIYMNRAKGKPIYLENELSSFPNREIFNNSLQSQQLILNILQQAADTAIFLFDRKVIWRDLNRNNFFIDPNNHRLTFFDFGLWFFAKEDDPIKIADSLLFIFRKQFLKEIQHCFQLAINKPLENVFMPYALFKKTDEAFKNCQNETQAREILQNCFIELQNHIAQELEQIILSTVDEINYNQTVDLNIGDSIIFGKKIDGYLISLQTLQDPQNNVILTGYIGKGNEAHIKLGSKSENWERETNRYFILSEGKSSSKNPEMSPAIGASQCTIKMLNGHLTLTQITEEYKTWIIRKMER